MTNGLVGLGTAALDVVDGAVYRAGARVALTSNEATVARALHAAHGDAVDRHTLMEALGYRAGVQTNAVPMTIRRLRSKLHGVGTPALHTVPRRGYRLDWSGASDDLVGRDALLRAATAELHSTRLVTLVGPGGVGKTRAAVELTALLHGAFEGRIATVSLAACRDPEATLWTIGRALSLQPGRPGTADRVARIGRYLDRLGTSLLVLDEAEHVAWEIGPVLARWLDDAPGLHLLVTSREPVGLSDERVLPVTPLTPGDARRLLALRRFEGDDTLLVDRADGLPLALEILARTPPSARPGAATDGGPLQRILWSSWDALDPTLQRLLARSTVFRGPFETAAAAAVAELGSPETAALRLGELAARSMVVRSGRWRLLGPVREFAAARLRERGDASRAIALHAGWFAQRATGHGDLLSLRDDADARDGLAADRADLWAVLEGQRHPGAALAVAVALRTGGEDRGDLGAYADRLTALLGWPHHPPSLRVDALLARAHTNTERCALAEALADLDLVASAELSSGQATDAALTRSRALSQLGDRAAMRDVLTRALADARARRDRHGQSRIRAALRDVDEAASATAPSRHRPPGLARTQPGARSDNALRQLERWPAAAHRRAPTRPGGVPDAPADPTWRHPDGTRLRIERVVDRPIDRLAG